MTDITPVRAVDALSVDTRPFDFSEIAEARDSQRLAVATTVVAAFSTVALAVAAIVLR
jgi:hypothetical protein